jgi:RNA polymerase sigma-70 factor (ECF subfamily)
MREPPQDSRDVDPMPDGLSDEHLAIKAKQGDQQAAGELLQRYGRYVYTIARRYLSHEDSRDAVQEVALIVIQKLNQYDGHSPFKPWLGAIARNHVYNRAGRDKWRDVVLLSDSSDTRFAARSGHDHEGAQELLRRIEQRIPQEDWQLFKNRFLEGLSYEEMAEMDDVSVGALRSRVCRIRASLRLVCQDTKEEVLNILERRP